MGTYQAGLLSSCSLAILSCSGVTLIFIQSPSSPHKSTQFLILRHLRNYFQARLPNAQGITRWRAESPKVDTLATRTRTSLGYTSQAHQLAARRYGYECACNPQGRVIQETGSQPRTERNGGPRLGLHAPISRSVCAQTWYSQNLP